VEVAALHILEANSPKLKGKKLLPIPPVAASTIISAGMLLIPIVLAALQEYNRISEAGATKACEHLHPILQMLWAIMKGLIRACTCALDQSAERRIYLCMIPLFIHEPALILANANQLQVQMHPEFEAKIDKVATGYLAITSMVDKDK